MSLMIKEFKSMNKELDELLCLLDGKITAYRMNNPYIGHKQHPDNIAHMKLIEIQKEIQELWKINKGV